MQAPARGPSLQTQGDVLSGLERFDGDVGADVDGAKARGELRPATTVALLVLGIRLHGILDSKPDRQIPSWLVSSKGASLSISENRISA
jgi:hypothetical protein